MEYVPKDQHCSKDEDGNYIDPITLDVIPTHRLVQVEGYCFDVKSLYITYVKTGKLDNPYTRQILPWKARKDIRVYGAVQQIEVTFQGKTFLADAFATLGRVLVNILTELGSTSLLLEKNFFIIGDGSIYDHDLDMPLEDLFIEDNEIVIEHRGYANVEILTKLKSFLQGESVNSNLRLIELIDAQIRTLNNTSQSTVSPTLVPVYSTTTTVTAPTSFRPRRAGESVPNYLREKYPESRYLDPLTFYRNEHLIHSDATDMTRILLNVIGMESWDATRKERALQTAMWLGKGLKITPDIFERISRVDAAGEARIRNTKNKLLNDALTEYGWPMRKRDGTSVNLSSLGQVTKNLVQKHPKWIAWRARNPSA